MFTFTHLRKSLQKKIPQITARLFSEIKVMSEKALGRGKFIIWFQRAITTDYFLKKSMYWKYWNVLQIKIENKSFKIRNVKSYLKRQSFINANFLNTHYTCRMMNYFFSNIVNFMHCLINNSCTDWSFIL